MGKQPEQDDEDWGLPGDDVLKDLLPLQETRQRSLFQRIVRQRAVYFADVEDGQIDGEDDDGIDGISGSKKSNDNKAGTDSTNGSKRSSDNQAGGQDENRLPSSGFADLSTWYCDAFQPTRSNFASLEVRPTRLISIVDQPTVALSLAALSPVHIADIPTQPNLSVISAPASNSNLSSRSAFALVGGKLRGALAGFCCHLLSAWLCRTRRVKCVRKKRPPVLKGHELLMERVREREERGFASSTWPIPPGGRRPRQQRLPADRLSG